MGAGLEKEAGEESGYFVGGVDGEAVLEGLKAVLAGVVAEDYMYMLEAYAEACD